MKERVRHLARQSAFYSLGNVAVKVGGLALAPVLLNREYLEVASYGYLALLLVSAQLGVLIVGLGISSGLLRFWTHSDFIRRQHALATTALLLTGGVAVLIPGAIYLFFSERIAVLLLDDAGMRHLVGLVLAYVGVKVIGAVPLTVFRVQERPLSYGAVQMLEVLLLVGLCFYWLVFSGRALEGVLLAYTAAAGITTLVSCGVVFVPMKWRFDATVVRPLLRFGAPLALASLSAWVLNSSDRYVLKWLSNPVVIAEYDWASRVAGIINVLLVQSFQLAFLVVGLRRLDDNDVSLHKEMFRHYVVWTGWAILGLAVLSDDAMLLMAAVFDVDRSYVEISMLVLLVGIGFWAYGISQIVSSVLTAAGRTVAVAFCVGVAAAANVGLNILMIPSLGGIGAAAATALAFIVMTFLARAFADRITTVGYEWSLAIAVLFAIIVLFGASMVGEGFPAGFRIMYRLGVLGCYFPLLLLTRVYRVGELVGGLRTIKSVLTLEGGRTWGRSG